MYLNLFRHLSKEALLRLNSSETDENFDPLDVSFEEAPKRIRLLDPNRTKALAILKEIEESSKPQ